ncbi:MAG: phosphate acyltransferase PlsX [Anaerolineae bacterium]|nr:phosphate acyltransferase PlsX [Anaerolineae bacterium]
MPVCQFQHQRDNLTIITGNVVVSSISVGSQSFLKKEEIMTIILDAMGSDDYPEPEILAAIELQKMGEDVLLVGSQEIIKQHQSKLGLDHIKLQVFDAPDIVEMTDKPVESARKKPNNSMAVGLNLVKEGKAEAFVTAGNTGAAYFNSVTILKRLSGISRPALTAIIPVKNRKCVFLDTGANADCRPEFLLEFAVMGSTYAGKLFNTDAAKVGLLSNGEEAGKGNQLVRDAYPLLQNSGLNFYGNVEPKEVYAGHVDVVVADGFSGNVFIKSSESVAKLILDILKEGISSRFLSKIGYLMAKPAFSSLKKMMDPSETGAGILLGVNGLVFIGHGRSDAHALISAVKLARSTIAKGLMESMRNEIQAKLSQPSLSSEEKG